MSSSPLALLTATDPVPRQTLHFLGEHSLAAAPPGLTHSPTPARPCPIAAGECYLLSVRSRGILLALTGHTTIKTNDCGLKEASV